MILGDETYNGIIDQILQHDNGIKLLILAPVARDRKGEFQKIFDDAKKSETIIIKRDKPRFNKQDK